MIDLRPTLNKAAIFVPELKPLIPGLLAALRTAETLEPAFAPIMARLEEGKTVFIEATELVGTVNENLPEIAQAVATLKKLGALIAQYQARLNLNN